jgi:hypothetical protein
MKRIRIISLLIVGILAGCESEIAAFEPTPTPPDLFVHPEPIPDWASTEPQAGSIIDAQAMEEVCITLLQEPLLRPGDFWQFFENISLTLNGERINTTPSHATLDAAVGLVDEGGNVIAEASYADMICWEVELEAGFHIAEALVWTSTGEEFPIRWAFQIIE